MTDEKKSYKLDGVSMSPIPSGNCTRFDFNEKGKCFSYTVAVSPDEVEKLLTEETALLSAISEHIIFEPVEDGAPGLTRITLKGGKYFEAGIPLGIIGAIVTPGTYYALSDYTTDEDEDGLTVKTGDSKDSILLLADSPDTVDLVPNVSLQPVTLSVINELNGEKVTGTRKELWSIHSDELDREATLMDLSEGMTLMSIVSESERLKEKKPKRKRPRKEDTINDHVTLTNTKVERAIFGDVEQSKLLRASDYTGKRRTRVTLGKVGESPIRLLDSELDRSNGLAFEKAESYLTDKERYWLTQLQSVLRDNPDKQRVYGSDMLTKAGYKKPLSTTMAETMEEACKASMRFTHISVWIDTTAENKAYRGKRVIRRAEDRRLVEGHVVIEKYDDGSSDFYIEFEGQREEGKTPLPLYDYARDKGELMDVPSEVFEFSNCGNVTAEHRRIMTYIYRQSMSKGLSDTILFETMFQRLCIADTKDKRYRVRKKLETLLDDWKNRSPRIIKSWVWKRNGKKIVGVTVHADRNYKTKLYKKKELEEIGKTRPRGTELPAF